MRRLPISAVSLAACGLAITSNAQLPDSGKYQGQFKNGLLHGKGKIVLPSEEDIIEDEE